jgi:hypothetical protein
MKIKKGDKFVCIKSLRKNYQKCFYIKGHMYFSIFDSCITDELGSPNHYWGSKYNGSKKHFVKLK